MNNKHPYNPEQAPRRNPVPRRGEAGPRPQDDRRRPPQQPPAHLPGGPQSVRGRQPRQAREEQMQTRPLHPYPGFTPEGGAKDMRREQKSQSKSKLLPVLLICVVIVGLLGGAYLFLNQNSQRQVAAMELRKSTNSFRMSGFAVQDAIIQVNKSLGSLLNLFTTTEHIAMQEPSPEVETFVDSDEDYNFIEKQHPSNMGRMVFPKIYTDGPLSDDATNDTLLYGFGIVPFMPSPGEDGMNVILGHRILGKRTSFYYLDEIVEGDPFYIDDYTTGTRYVYTTRIHENVTEEEYFLRFNPDGRPEIQGQTSMLVVCDPLIYNASERRILVYGELTNKFDIPGDDPYFQRYKDEHGISEVAPAEEEVAE